jgi:high-affinity K+ transport system ATPase subunit B
MGQRYFQRLAFLFKAEILEALREGRGKAKAGTNRKCRRAWASKNARKITNYAARSAVRKAHAVDVGVLDRTTSRPKVVSYEGTPARPAF